MMLAQGYRMTQLVKRAAAENGTGTSTIMDDRTRTWDETCDRVARLAAGLHSMGVTRGCRIAILALNSDRYFEALFAIWWAGCEVVPVNTRWAAAEVAYSLNDASVNTIFFDAVFAQMVPELTRDCGALNHAVFLGAENEAGGAIAHDQLIADNTPMIDASQSGEELAGVLYTGGTTGFPKGVMLTHTNLWANTQSVFTDFYLKTGCCGLHVAPMFHAADLVQSLTVTAKMGTHVFLPSFNPETTLKAIHHHKVTCVLMVPAMIKMVLEHHGSADYDLSSVETVMYGASPIPEVVLRGAMELFHNAGFLQVYGQTELAPIATLLKPEDHVLDGPLTMQLRSCGKAVSFTEMAIVDEQGVPQPDGVQGEIIVRGPGVMRGYLNKPDQTAATLKNGWLYTGDGGYRDKNGFYYVSDRMKDMIVTGGENVYSTEVENAVMGHKAVAGVAVIGIPDDEWGEAVHAIIILKDGTKLKGDDLIKSIKDHCKEQIAGYKCPKSISFRKEPFPLSGANKVLKTELRKPFWDGQTRGVN